MSLPEPLYCMRRAAPLWVFSLGIIVTSLEVQSPRDRCGRVALALCAHEKTRLDATSAHCSRRATASGNEELHK